MPVKRRHAKERKFTVTPETLAIWRICSELLADGSGEAGGENREEYLALMSKFDMALHLTPWDHHPTFVDGPIAPAWASPLHGVESWARAWEMRQAFEKATREAEAFEAAEVKSGGSPVRPRLPSALRRAEGGQRRRQGREKSTKKGVHIRHTTGGLQESE